MTPQVNTGYTKPIPREFEAGPSPGILGEVQSPDLGEQQLPLCEWQSFG